MMHVACIITITLNSYGLTKGLRGGRDGSPVKEDSYDSRTFYRCFRDAGTTAQY